MPEITGNAEFTLDFQVYCSCGNGLCNQTTVDNRRQHVIVEPCQRCLDRAESQGYNTGYESAMDRIENKGG